MPTTKIQVPAGMRSTSAFKKLKLNLSNQQIDKNGRYTNKSTLRKRSSIQKGIDIMASQGIIYESDTPKTTQRMSEELLFALGYTVEEDGADFTLVDTQSPTKQPAQLSIPENIAKDYAPIESFDMSAMSIVSSFPNHFNPIFIADEQEPRNLQPLEQAIYNRTMYEHLDLVDTAVRCATMGIRNTRITKTTKYFDNNQVSISLASKRNS